MTIQRKDIEKLLSEIDNPFGPSNIMDDNVVRALTIDDTSVRFVMEVDAANAERMESVRLKAEEMIKAIDGVSSVSGLLTAHSAPTPPPDLKSAKKKPAGPQRIPGIKKIILVGSGKGGVGKSTVTSNLAAALVAEGKKVGLMDADVYGPSQPQMLGIEGRPASPDGTIILPLTNHGITMMSVGLMIKKGEAIVWRGPMLMGAMQQMLNQVQWGELDVLLIDLPPGTGDIQLTLTQKTQIDGAIIVSTPQDVALIDARKAINMFEKLNTPVIGMIENMSTHICSNCGHEEHLFGHGGARLDAEKSGLPFLGEIPLDIDIRLASDSGTPIVTSQPDSDRAKAFSSIAQALIEKSIV